MAGNYSKILKREFTWKIDSHYLRYDSHHAITAHFQFSYYYSDEGWLFAHEAGHCLGGMHVRSKGKILATLFRHKFQTIFLEFVYFLVF